MIKNLVVFFIPILLVGCHSTGSRKNIEHTKGVITVTKSKVLKKDIVDTVVVFGYVKARREAFLSSQFAGRLKDFSFLPGDKVKKGELTGIVVPPIREALNSNMQGLSVQQQQLIRNEVKEIPLYTPISGIVVEVMHHEGDVLQPGESIIHIVDLSELDVYGDIPLRHYRRLKQLKSVDASFVDFSDIRLSLPVVAYNGKVDEKKQTISVRLLLVNPKEEFRPGMVVRLSFPSEVHKDVVVIPRRALLEDEGVYSVFVIDNNNIVHHKNVQCGIFNSDFVEVVSGLKGTEDVIVDKAYSLTDGLKVKVE